MVGYSQSPAVTNNMGSIWLSTNTSSATTTDAIWHNWSENRIIYSTNSSSRAWHIWTTDTFTTGNLDCPPAEFRLPPEESARQRQEYNQRCKIIDLRERIKNEGAKRRGRELLRRVLSEDQWREWELYESVRIFGSEGGLWEVGNGWAGMLYRLGLDGEPVQKICYHPPHDFNKEDRVATLVLELKTNEARIRSEGNENPFDEHEKDRIRLRRAHRRIA